MKVTIEFDMTTTEHPVGVSNAASQLMLAARGLFDTKTLLTEAVPEEDAVPVDETPAQTVARRRGRKSNAEKEAERLAAEAQLAAENTSSTVEPATGCDTVETPATEPEKAVFVPPAGPAPAMFTPNISTLQSSMPVGAVYSVQSGTNPNVQTNINPNVQTTNALPSFPPVGPTPIAPAVATTVQRPAMPPAESPTGDTVEDLRAVMAKANAKQPGSTFRILRRNAWLDGSEKESWLVAENVPAQYRARMMAEISQEMSL